MDKTKVDKKVNGEIVFKTRDSIESQVYPTSKIIGDLSTSDTELFVDNSRFFNYEEDNSALVVSSVGGLIVGAGEPVSMHLQQLSQLVELFKHLP